MIKGINVLLHIKTSAGVDDFGQPIFVDTTEEVNNVLIGEPTTDDITSSTQLYGKRLAYTLAIPKDDTHDWKDTEVEFFGKTFKTFGDVTQGIEENIPLKWNKKVKVEFHG